MPKIRPGILGVPRSAGYPRSSSAPMKQPGDSGGDRRLPPARSDNRSSGGRMVTSAPWAPTQGRQHGRGREPKRRRLVLCCIHGAPGDSTRRIRLQLAAAVRWADLVRRPCSDSGSDTVRPMGRNPCCSSPELRNRVNRRSTERIGRTDTPTYEHQRRSGAATAGCVAATRR